jgi:tRNA G18 (ribose-2'-O)-methylase SpoU
MKCVLVLDNIRSVENVGAIFRTADAAGVHKIYLMGITPGPLDRFERPRADLRKSALGAELTVPWERLEKLEELGREYELVALEQDARSIDYKEYKPKENNMRDFALILGPEVGGLSKEVLDTCDKIISIPMKGKKESLNVSVAAGIALFRLLDI